MFFIQCRGTTSGLGSKTWTLFSNKGHDSVEDAREKLDGLEKYWGERDALLEYRIVEIRVVE